MFFKIKKRRNEKIFAISIVKDQFTKKNFGWIIDEAIRVQADTQSGWGPHPLCVSPPPWGFCFNSLPVVFGFVKQPKIYKDTFQKLHHNLNYVLPLRHVVQSSKLLCFSVRNFATLTLSLQQDLLAHYYMFFMAQK